MHVAAEQTQCYFLETCIGFGSAGLTSDIGGVVAVSVGSVESYGFCCSFVEWFTRK